MIAVGSGNPVLCSLIDGLSAALSVPGRGAG